jgi:hypothetical protein
MENPQLTPEMIAAILAQNASRPAVPQAPPSEATALTPSRDVPAMISEKPFSFSSPDPGMTGRVTAFGAQSAPLTPFSSPTENPLNLLDSRPVEAPAPTDLLEQRRVDIVAGPFAIGSFSPPPAPPVAPPVTAVQAQIPVVSRPVAPVVKKPRRKKKDKSNISQINVSRSK